MLAAVETKVCKICDKPKELSEFSRCKDYLQSYCKPCSAEKAALYRAANLEVLKERRHAKRAEDPEKFRRIESERYYNSAQVRLSREARDRPCVDCGLQLPIEVMELDHVRGDKLFTLGGRPVWSRTEDEIRTEIDKCEVRCPNCHKLRHHWEREDAKTPPVKIDYMSTDSLAL